MQKEQRHRTTVGITARTDPYMTVGTGQVQNDKFWRWRSEEHTSELQSQR